MSRWKAGLLVPVAVGAAAAALFAAQGGFGGGDGPFDFALWLLGQPAIRVVGFLPVWPGDLVAIVLLPAALNVALWSVLLVVAARIAGARRT